MPAMTSPNVATAIVNLVAADAISRLAANLVVGTVADASFKPEVCQPGDVAKDEERDVSAVLRHAEATFTIPDVTKVLAVPDLLSLYMEPAIISIAWAIEQRMLEARAAFSKLASGSVSDGSVVADADTVLTGLRAPRPRFLVMDPGGFNTMRRLPAWREHDNAGAAQIRTRLPLMDAIGQLYNVYVLRSSYVSAPLVNGDTPTIAFGDRALTLHCRRLPLPLPGTGAIGTYAELCGLGLRVVMPYQPNTLRQNVTIDVLYGVTVDANAGARVLCR